MSDVGLLRPGTGRALGLTSDAAFVRAVVDVEAAWLEVLGTPGSLTVPGDLAAIADGGERAGNPIVPILAALRDKAPANLHAGLTSQDTLDTALMVLTLRVRRRLLAEADGLLRRLGQLAQEHQTSLMCGRTLTQTAVPITFGLKVSQWLTAVAESVSELRGLPLPVQCGGAAGTLSLISEYTDAVAAPGLLARQLDLDVPALPWHTRRRPLTAVADALTGLLDALGTMAADVSLLSRPEIGELSEGVGGGSSTMPHKHNPVLSVLIRSAALQAPALAAGLHTASGQMVDERPDGAWHAQWALYRDLLTLALVATSQARDLAEHLQVHAEVMHQRAQESSEQLLAERQRVDATVTEPSQYVGAAHSLVDAALAQVPALPHLAFTRLRPGDGDVLIVGAGLGTTSSTLWAQVAADLPGYEVIGVDLPGHGASAVSSRGFAVADLADVVRAAAEQFAGRRVWYAGVSLAGAVALELALRPGSICGVVSIASASKLGTVAAWRERAALVRQAGTAVMVAGSAQRWFAPGFSSEQPQAVGAMLDDLVDVDDASYAACCEALAAYDLTDSLGSAQVPVLLIPGDNDVVVSVDTARVDAQRLPQSDLVVARGAAHQPPIEVSAQIAADLREFMEAADV